MLQPLSHRLTQWLFEPGEHWLRQLLQPALKGLRYPYALLRDLAQGELNLRAMSLVYSTLLSIAPFLALAFSVLKGLGYDQDMEIIVYQFLEPIGDQATELTARVMGFVDGVRGGVLGPISLAFLIYTVISTVQKVEESFNFVWQVEKPRSWARRLSEYLSVMVLAPVFIVALIALLHSSSVEQLSRVTPVAWTLQQTRQWGTFLLVSFALTFLYHFIPNTRVRFNAALAGGLTAGALWTAGGALFARFAANSSQTTLIYAGFAIVILALIWIYLTWLILLVGAQLSFYVQHPQSLRSGRRDVQLTASLQEKLGLSVMYLVARDYQKGTPRWTLNSLAEHFNVPSASLEPVIQKLEMHKLLVTSEEERYLPGRNPDGILLSDILDTLYRDPHNTRAIRARGNGTVEQVIDGLRDTMHQQLEGRTLTDLVNRHSEHSTVA